MSSPPPRSDKQIATLKVALERRDLLRFMIDICKQYNVTLEAVLAGRRNTRVVQARDACIFRVMMKTSMSSVETGELFDMDHTSIQAAKVRYQRRDMGRLLQ